MSSEPSRLPGVLRELREAAGLTLREVEQRSGDVVSNGYLSQLESGHRPSPNPRVLTALASVYAVPVKTLFEAAGYVDAPPVSEVERAFRQVLADPDFKFGTRMRGELTTEAKRLFVELYERATGKQLLVDDQ